ncbi:MAG: hypothetical protein J7599_19040 [Niabella sp.]|nr:hypothetical protein [Niabella sp.]
MEPIIRRMDFKDGAIGTLTILEIGDGDELKSWNFHLENSDEKEDSNEYVIQKNESGRYLVYIREVTYPIDSGEFENWYQGSVAFSAVGSLKACDSDFCTQLADAVNDEVGKIQ